MMRAPVKEKHHDARQHAPLSPAQPAGNTTKKAPDRFPTIDVEASISTEVPNDSLRLNLCA